MPKEPLYSHIPKKKEPLFPHVTKSQQEWLPAVTPETGTCYQDAWRFVIKEGEGYLVHGTVWSRDRRIGHAWVETETGWIWEPETGRYFTSLGFINVFAPGIESRYTPEEAAIMAARTNHHGPWTEQERHQYLVVKQLQTVPKKTTLRVVCAYCGKYIRSVPGYGVSGVSHGICEECATVEWEKLIDHIAQTRGITRDEARKLVERGKMLPMAELLASTEGNPISKFCCRLCGECAPKELLEDGRFLDRISWLRSHYKEKHPGMWGKMSPMTTEEGEPVPLQYRHLVSLVSEPLPRDAY